MQNSTTEFKQKKLSAKDLKGFASKLNTPGVLIKQWRDPVFLIDTIEKGLKTQVILSLQSQLELSDEKMAYILQMKPRTFSRRKTEPSLKPIGESEAGVRIVRLWEMALNTFGDKNQAKEWFIKPKQMLGNIAPIDLCRTEPGAREVEDELIRIEWSVY
ncbi:DUF2384 domain-containing protein [Zooshikella marina]|uniref:type II RES/Xre toxin-antitoxin system antitoxin n=1 Tax=Zooshikella ganghwensis TaxID=202772 RepID=UPI001BAEAFDF|nr:antitoxin Xre/MbcA/ParS toxin-binding domain-containing protein [Zooshikella ganghwensis]MBU2708715.1 DUF2384 domain-containing protein [Zooshikella ganghwensis]